MGIGIENIWPKNDINKSKHYPFCNNQSFKNNLS